jgi:hypothetical protein
VKRFRIEPGAFTDPKYAQYLALAGQNIWDTNYFYEAISFNTDDDNIPFTVLKYPSKNICPVPVPTKYLFPKSFWYNREEEMLYHAHHEKCLMGCNASPLHINNGTLFHKDNDHNFICTVDRASNNYGTCRHIEFELVVVSILCINYDNKTKTLTIKKPRTKIQIINNCDYERAIKLVKPLSAQYIKNKAFA